MIHFKKLYHSLFTNKNSVEGRVERLKTISMQDLTFAAVKIMKKLVEYNNYAWFNSQNTGIEHCVRDKTFTSLNIVQHVENSFENSYTVWWCIFKATGGGGSGGGLV